MQVLQSSMD